MKIDAVVVIRLSDGSDKKIERQFDTEEDAKDWLIKMWENKNLIYGGTKHFGIC